jgi:imidazolonepropionase-like amidohydrolase
MWDVHTHFVGDDVVAGQQELFLHFLPGAATLVGAVTVADLRAILMAGFTSVRELGGYAGDLVPIVDKGVVVGPHIYSSMSVLSITGGHGDVHEAPLATVMGAGGGVSGIFAICDGVEECTRTVRQVIRRGAKVIKICSTGGVLSTNDQPEDSQFSPEELRAIVSEATRSGRAVASHAIGKGGIMAALDAGVKTIEHGMYLDEEVAARMAEKDAILVPTRHIVEVLSANPDGLTPPSRVKMERMVQLSRDSLKLAVKSGVKIALGTDTGSSNHASPLAHGKNAMELHWAVEAGMTPLQAIEMATATPPETLYAVSALSCTCLSMLTLEVSNRGSQARKAGQLKPGYDADIIAVASNPLDDIDVLTKQSNVTHVWKGGKLLKSPLKQV